VVFRWLILCLALLALGGCSARNPARTDLCLGALAGLEPGDSRLIVSGVDGEGPLVVVRYAREAEPRTRVIECRFAGDATALGQLDLQSVIFDGEELGPGRLTYLKSFWLGTGGPFMVRARILLPDAGLFTVSKVSGPYVQAALSATPIASVYVLLALGFALIHGLTGRMNIAHGEFATVGAYAGFAGFMLFGGLSLWAGIAGAIGFGTIAAASAGYFTIAKVFAPLARREGQMLLVASAGLIIVFEEAIRISHASRELWLPPVLADPIRLSPPPYVVTVTGMQIVIGLVAAVIAAAVLGLIRFTRFGMAWRAVADDALAARLVGLDPTRVLVQAALLATGLAGAAGLAILLGYGNANHAMGLMLSIKAMVAAVIGGMGSPLGAVLGALTLVAVETFWVVAFGGSYRDAAVFLILIGLLTLAPNGLFGLARR
jgi:branched-chain amino acid transport system permease protein